MEEEEEEAAEAAGSREAAMAPETTGVPEGEAAREGTPPGKSL